MVFYFRGKEEERSRLRKRRRRTEKRIEYFETHFGLTEVDDVDFAPNGLAVLSHGLAVRALRYFGKEKEGGSVSEKEGEKNACPDRLEWNGS